MQRRWGGIGTGLYAPIGKRSKLDVMRAALRYKFNHHPSLIHLLLSTKDEEIIERTTDDLFWGCGSNGSGLNLLGQLLMELREIYRKQRGPIGLAVSHLP
jgi:ribA/ribD-fused uncharacterized protein